MSKLSIITINLDNWNGLKKTIESVISQTFSDFEYIIIDGGSTDESVNVIKSFETRIAYWISEPDKGIYNAMNKGIMKARGEYCLFLNSGDYLIDDNILNRVFRLNMETDIFCQTGLGGKPVEDITFYDFFVDSLKHQTMFFRTSLFHRLGLYDERYRIISDWAFYTLAIVKSSCSLSFYDFPFYVVQEGGISWLDGNGIYNERELFMREYFPHFYANYLELQSYRQSKYVSLYKKLIKSKFVISLYKLIRR